MKNPLEEFLRVKADAEAKRAAAERAEGAAAQLKRQLNAAGCKTLADAEKMLAKIDAELEEAERELAEGIEAYDKKWDER